MQLLLEALSTDYFIFANSFDNWVIFDTILEKDVVHAAHFGLIVTGFSISSELAD